MDTSHEPIMSDDGLSAQFCAFTGLEDVEQAKTWLEMAGGNVEMAVGLFFESGGAMGGGDGGFGSDGGFGGSSSASASSNAAAAGPPVPDWFRSVWPPSVRGFSDVPEAWAGQSLRFEGGGGIGLPQPRNGPCGVLAAVQAAALADLCRRRNAGAGSAGGGSDQLRPAVTDDVLASVLADMVWQARPGDGDGATLVTGAGADAVQSAAHADRDSLLAAATSSLGAFKSPGGANLLVYSLVLTRTVEGVRRDVRGAGGDLPLVNELSLCTSDLVALCLRGRADGNFGAYPAVPGGSIQGYGGEDEDGVQKLDRAPGGLGVGLLSMDVYQTKIPVADELLSPRHPVWLLHGGDHFTVAFAEDLRLPSPPVPGAATSIALLHWNGLPPSGPRLARLVVRAEREAGPAPKRRKSPVQYAPVIGEVESIVQADPAMKRSSPNGWTGWRYEVQVAGKETVEEGTKYEPRPESVPLPPAFDLKNYTPAGNDGGWRCAACYSTRFQTMCFGMNDAKADGGNDPKCDNCARPRSVVGFTIWLRYDELPDKWKQSADRQFAPKVVSVLRTKWPGARIEVAEDGSYGKDDWPSV